MKPSSIRTQLYEVAETLGPSARDTILYENLGKHMIEIALILENLGQDSTVVDLGGGLGINLICLRRIVQTGLHTFLVDRFEEYNEENRMGQVSNVETLLEQSGVSVIKRDLYQCDDLPFQSDSCDIVTVFDVLEHFPGHPLKLLAEARRILKPNGVLIIGGPNAASLIRRIRLLAGRHPYMPFDLWCKDKYYAHFREYTANEYRRLVETCGLEHTKTLMVAEPSRTMAGNRYRHGKQKVMSVHTALLYAVYLTDLLFRNLRPSVYCIGRKCV